MLKFKQAGFLIEILGQDHVFISKIALKNMTAGMSSFAAVDIVSDFDFGLRRIEGLTLWKVIMWPSVRTKLIRETYVYCTEHHLDS